MGGLSLYFFGSLAINGVNETIATISSRNFFLLALFNQPTIITNSGLLWFLLALIFCYIIYYIFPRFFQKKYLFLFVAALWFVVICSSIVYGGIVVDKWPSFVQQSYIGFGLPYFTLGYLIHAYWGRIEKLLTNKS